MKILHFIPWSGYGGSEQQFANLLEELNTDDCKNYVNLIITGKKKGALINRYREFSDSILYLDYDQKFNYRPIDQVDKFYKKHQPDIVHVFRPGGEGLFTAPFILGWPTPVVVTTLCDRDEASIWWADAHIVPSNYVKSLQSEDHHNRHVVYHSVKPPSKSKNVIWDSQRVRRIVSEATQSSPRGVACRIGTLDRTKRVMDAVEAVRGLRERSLILGGRNIYGWYETNKERLPENVYYVGEVSERDKWNILHESDVLLYPTTKEAFGIVFVEAMLSGLPIITYDDSANREIIGDDFGYYCHVNDISLLRARVKQAKRLVVPGMVDKRYSPSWHKNKIERIYNGLLLEKV